MKKLLLIILPLVLVCLGGCETRECIKSHKATVMTPMSFGKAFVLMPQIHTICDIYSGEVQ